MFGTNGSSEIGCSLYLIRETEFHVSKVLTNENIALEAWDSEMCHILPFVPVMFSEGQLFRMSDRGADFFLGVGGCEGSGRVCSVCLAHCEHSTNIGGSFREGCTSVQREAISECSPAWV